MDSANKVRNILCSRAQDSKWTEVIGDDPSMVYKCTFGAAKVASDDSLFPFLPESVMHMETHYLVMKRINSCYPKEVVKANASGDGFEACTGFNSTATVVMRLYGYNVRSERVTLLSFCAHALCAEAQSRDSVRHFLLIQAEQQYNTLFRKGG